MPKLQPLRIVLSATDRVSGPLRRIEGKIDAFGRKATRVGRTLTTHVGLPIGLVGVASGKMAAEFDAAMRKITSLVGISKEEVDGFRGAIFSVAKATGRMPAELADALFFITSAGLRGSNALELLRASAEAAAAGMGDAKTVADAATSAMNAYGPANLSASDAVGVLVAAVREGKLEASDLAPVIGRVLKVAQSAGIGFRQVAASIAAMTRVGIPAEEAATYLARAILSFQKVTPQADRAMKHFHLSAAGLREELGERGLLATLQHVARATHGNAVAMNAIFPNIRAVQGIMALAGKDSAYVQQVFDSIAHSGAPDLERAFAAIKGPAFRFGQALATVAVAGIRLGTVILPIVTPWVSRLGREIGRLADRFGKLSPTWQKTILAGTAFVALVGPLVLGIGLAASSASALTAVLGGVATALNLIAFTPVGATLLAVAGAGYLIWKNWKPIKKLFSEIWGVLEKIASGLSGYVGAAVSKIAGFFGAGGAPAPVANALGGVTATVAGATGAVASSGAAAVRQTVGGVIRLQVEGNQPVKVKHMSAHGGIDLEVDQGLAMAGGGG